MPRVDGVENLSSETSSFSHLYNTQVMPRPLWSGLYNPPVNYDLVCVTYTRVSFYFSRPCNSLVMGFYCSPSSLLSLSGAQRYQTFLFLSGTIIHHSKFTREGSILYFYSRKPGRLHPFETREAKDFVRTNSVTCMFKSCFEL